MLNFKELHAAQSHFDTYIMEKRGLDSMSLKQERYLALLVEIGELANSIRFFKFWSDNQEINRSEALEEYADCMKFLLSLGNMHGYSTNLDVTVMKIQINLEGTLTELFIDLFNVIVNFRNTPSPLKYLQAWGYLLTIAERIDFTNEDIVNAFYKKDKINYKRQESGY